jgi:endonuclease YncB( thermonuclease family)
VSDFEVMPIGTTARLEALEAYARKASDALARLGAGGRYDVPMQPIGEDRYADPLFCEARVETRLRNARGRFSSFGGGKKS